MRLRRMERWIGIGLAGLPLILLAPTIGRSQEAPPNSSDTSYGYVSTSEGDVTLLESDTGESVSVEGTEALLAGDELRLGTAARAEVQLADGNLLRLDDRAELVFLTLAGSPDRSDPVTALRLRRGSLQILVVDNYLGDTAPVIETDNAYVELKGAGTYLIEALSAERTLVIARRGDAQVRAGSAVTTLRSREEAVIEGYDGARVRLAAARGLLPVERWGEALAATHAGTTELYVDESIRYAAAPLRSHGTWTWVRGTRAWRPHVKTGWRPYSRGRWRHTPTGLFWVSYEPWGWVPHHYGNWDLVPGFGWVWFPGRRFASAWVSWYWGPQYVGWVPWGYYSNRFGWHPGLSLAAIWAGGLGIHFRDWCFTPYNRFGHRDQHRYLRSGRDMGREGERIARGIITTDTRDVTPGHWTSPDRVNQVLAYDGRGKKFELEEVGPLIETAGREVNQRPSIDPVRTTRTVELRPTGREPPTRETARREVNQRPSIDPVRTTRTVELRPKASSRPTTKRPSVGERTRVPTQVSRPTATRRPTSVRPSTPKRAATGRTATPRSSPTRTTGRATARARPSKPSKSKPD